MTLLWASFYYSLFSFVVVSFSKGVIAMDVKVVRLPLGGRYDIGYPHYWGTDDKWRKGIEFYEFTEDRELVATVVAAIRKEAARCPVTVWVDDRPILGHSADPFQEVVMVFNARVFQVEGSLYPPEMLVTCYTRNIGRGALSEYSVNPTPLLYDPLAFGQDLCGDNLHTQYYALLLDGHPYIAKVRVSTTVGDRHAVLWC
jgi:hypothetical protein